MRRIIIPAVIILLIGGTLAYLAFIGLLRPLYFAAITEVRLVRRGQPMVQFRFNKRDHMNQILIPAGEFTMGSEDVNTRTGDVQHKVYVSAYWIDQFTVTNSMYALCVKAKKCRQPATLDNYFTDPSYGDYPVHYINWYDAARYCKWSGGRLPTEAEWEKAARGVNALRYPWGNGQPDATLLNYNGALGDIQSSYSHWAGMSPYGLLNMAGNVQQWVRDWYSADYYAQSPYKDPTGPTTGDLRVLRGGGYWDDSKEVQTFFRFRHDPTSSGAHRGIRCADNP